MAGQAVLGLIAFVALAWLLSEGRRRVPWRVVAVGLAAQLLLALLLLRVPPVAAALGWLNRAVMALQAATLEGTAFVFGYLGGGTPPFDPVAPAKSFILAFQGLPLILVVSALSALLFYWGVLPLVVRGFTWALRKTLGLSGAAGVAAAANIFVGMIEAPLLIRPYLTALSRADLFLVMTVGMATIAGNMFVLYAVILGPVVPDAAGNLLTASVMSAPAAVAIAAIMIPGAAGAADRADAAALANPESDVTGSTEALVKGTLSGIQLVIGVAATLIVAVALVSLVNQAVGLLPEVAGAPLSLQRILGWGLAPLAWLMGVPWSEAPLAGELMGSKVVLNELIAYLKLAALPEGSLSPASRAILLYGLCGFANLGSLGILIGGLCTMVPERRAEIVALGPKSLVSGNLACFMTGAVAGLLG